MVAAMGNAKTIRLRSDQATWLAAQADDSGLSENRVIGALIDNAMTHGDIRVGIAGWNSGHMPDPGKLPEDVPQVPGLLSEDRPHGLRH